MSQRAAVVYLVRHGQTALNVAGVLRGRLDPPLDEVGAAQTAALGLVFATVPLVAVEASPLARARQTAARIAEATGAPLAVAAELLDRDTVSCAGQSLIDVARCGGSLDAAPGVDLADAFAARTVAAMCAIATRWAPGPVAVIAHDGVNRQVLACRCPELGVADAIGQRTGCWNRLERSASGWVAPIVDAVADDGRRP